MGEIGKNGLTEKELYCLAWHFKHFWPVYVNDDWENLQSPCTDCKYVEECCADGAITHHLEMIHTLENLLDIKVFDKDTF